MKLLSPFAPLLIFLFAVPAFAAFGTGGRVFVSTPVSNHPKKTVEDCMSPIDYERVLRADMSVDESMKVLLENNLTGAPVVDDAQRVVGIVTSYDMIQREAYEGALLPIDGTVENVNLYIDCAKKICGQKVEDIMTPDPATVSSDTPMRVAASMMMKNKLHHLPVVDETGKLAGVLTTEDVMKDLLYVVQYLPAADEETSDSSEDLTP